MNLWPFFVNMHSDSSCELKCNTYNKHQEKRSGNASCFSSFSSLVMYILVASLMFCVNRKHFYNLNNFQNYLSCVAFHFKYAANIS